MDNQIRQMVIFLVALILAGCSVMPASQTAEIVVPTPAAGALIEPPRPLADFTLTGHTGQPMHLSDFRGNPTLLFFGYTYCPDVCPATLVDFKEVRGLLGDAADRVHYVFISVDSARDTPDRLERYVHGFDPSFVGMTGDEALLRRIGADYGLFFERREVPGTRAGYLIDHTAPAYLIDAEGRLKVVYPFNTPPAIIAQDVATMLE